MTVGAGAGPGVQCEMCGHRNHAGDRFCERCGIHLTPPPSPVPPPGGWPPDRSAPPLRDGTTRYLCAAAHMDAEFAQRAIGEYLIEEVRVVPPSPGLDTA